MAHQSPHGVLLLLLPGFDELIAARCLVDLQRLGRPVQPVAITPPLVRGRWGTQWRVDPPAAAPQIRALVILAGPPTTANLTDPRLYQLVRAVCQAGGVIIMSDKTAVWLARLGEGRSGVRIGRTDAEVVELAVQAIFAQD